MERVEKIQVLVADDDEFSQTLTLVLLEQLGCSVEIAMDGVAAIEAVQKNIFDLVLMDCMMPVMDGFEATREIRALNPDQHNPGIPIIALTGHPTEDDLRTFQESGMDDQFSKPLDLDTLTAILQRHVHRYTCSTEVSNTQPGEHYEIPESVIEKFLLEIPETIAKLSSAVSKGQMDRLQFLGHRLRGGADVMGVTSLSGFASALELAAKNADLELATKMTSRLIVELENLVTALSVPQELS